MDALIIGSTIFLIGMACMVRANLLAGEIVAEINRLVPEEREISPIGFIRLRFFDILADYRRLCPGGKLALHLSIWSAIGFACFLGSASYWFFSGAASAGYIPKLR